MVHWTWAAAASRGTSHARSNTRLQDAFSCTVVPSTQTLIAVISDGAGSSVYGGEGASLTCRTLVTLAKAHAQSGLMPSDDTIFGWIDIARERISRAADNRGLLTRDFAATVICLLSSGFTTVVAHIGDGSAVVRSDETSDWHVASWPNHGEYASTTYFITDSEPNLKISRYDYPISAVALFSDGIERLALDFAVGNPHTPFFNGIIRPIEKSESKGRDPQLSNMLATYLSGEVINSRTDDDKSLILAVRQ